MKKILCIVLLMTAAIGCKSTSAVSTKLDNKTERILKGNFTITAVNFPGSDFLNVTSFYIADSKCFVGSNWSFISNNNKGEMSLNTPDTSCKEFSSPITWYLNKDGNFVLKIINDYKAKEVNNGFVLNIKNVTETSFDLVDQINVAGQTKDITYSFQRQ
ncbi:lipocalin family protein [Polaribacter sp. Z014]|uniref:lipocalin family protein n=1 Tax=unclassified Polaribacter TaxID=196858 RepID=UPI00201FD0E7|nr:MULTISPECIES: lipocalin family protein [unclassified Polaribacter]MCL7763087.1 lipocalin family protein [Polaribacter sp. Z014]